VYSVTRRSTGPARESWASIHRLFFDQSVHGRVHQICDELGINPGLMKAMFQLQPNSPKSMRTLAEEWSCDASYVTTLVDGLEARDFVERRVSATDRRVKLVVLTPAGEKARQRLFELMHEPPPFFDALTAAEQRQLRDLLVKLVDAAVAATAAERSAASRDALT
jgi:DNA-binding MarR family transcriptional regulator